MWIIAKTIIYLCVFMELVSAKGKCTLVKGTYQRNDAALNGCQYSYSVEFCPRHRHIREQISSVTVEIKSNMTRPGFVSVCALHNKVFSSVVRGDFKKVATATRILNMTSMEGTFRSSMLYSVVDELNATASKMQFSLHNNLGSTVYDPITVDFVLDRESGSVAFVSPFQNVPEAPEIIEQSFESQHVAGEEHKSNERVKCDMSKLLSGQWNYDATNKAWRWRTHTCDSEQITVEAFVAWCKKYNLKSIMFIGTSRTRTLLYDLLLFFGYTLEEVKPDKPHHHLTYNVQDKLNYDLTLHLHWDDCMSDVADGQIYSYDHIMTEMKQHFAEINICTHPSNVPNRVPSNFVHVPSNVNYTTFNYTSTNAVSAIRPYAVIFTIGIYEAIFVNADTFKTRVPSLVRFVYESCMGAIPTYTSTAMGGDVLLSSGVVPNLSTSTDPDINASKNMFFVRLEEAVDPSVTQFDPLNQVNDYMYNTIVPELNVQLRAHKMPLITLLDTYHISRGWKVWKTDRDQIHYYAEHSGFHGNHVSHTMVNVVLQQLAQSMDERLRAAHNDSPAVPHLSDAHYAPLAHPQLFPLYSSLPEYHYDAVAPLEGKLLKSPHDRREIFFVHGGVKRSIPNWDTFVALNIDLKDMVHLNKEEFDAVPTGAPLPPAE